MYQCVHWCSQLNQSEFQDMDDETRVQYEGFRPGMYVRVEVSPKIDVLILLTFFPTTYLALLVQRNWEYIKSEREFFCDARLRVCGYVLEMSLTCMHISIIFFFTSAEWNAV